MKQLIVLMGVLPILVLFIMQYSLEQKNNDYIQRFQEYVYTAKEQAKQTGYFDENIKQELAHNLSTNLNIPDSEIVMNVTEVPKFRTNTYDDRELIYYKISVPIERLMAGNKFLGISDEDNRGWYTIESKTASELIK
ncbi:hypothetical protein [Anaerovorax odorimutans]|uniref:hypothetical protein n=1 Tax=Anaerovorax odorimutans TaxID=109327 RepID=UPI000425F7C2|nr:hypothetical protein [Anaerovorax odorimutans]